MTMTTLTKQYIDDHCINLGISWNQLTEFVVPDSVTEIHDEAFMGCTSLQSITFLIALLDWKGLYGLLHSIHHNP